MSSSPQIRWWEFVPGIGLILLFFWKLTFTNLILARGDTFLYFYPLWEYRAEALLAGRLPLWNPYLFMGAPFLANPQTGVLYPLNWPLAFFPAPIAVKIAIVTHVLIAFSGAQLFARRALGQSAAAALLSATAFALGGYLTAQAEHVNQLQALAWFPWLLLTLGIRDWKLEILTRAAIIALQLLAGHTQSVFISLTGFLLYSLILNLQSSAFNPHSLLSTFYSLLVALPLTAAQLLPTLELSRESLRAGGLTWNEALSFSLDPRLLGRALLPGYSRSLFTEFVAYPGLAALALALFGAVRERRRIALLALAGVGLAFAFGAFNPLYAGLALAPPFNLFRVPARWLFLFAFGVAMLAGYGLDKVQEGKRWEKGDWRFWVPAISLMLLTTLATNFTPPGETGPLGLPLALDVAGWLAALLALALLLYLPLPSHRRAPGIVALIAVELFAASQALPFNKLTTPEAYTSIRPAMTQLLANLQSPVPHRFLSMSALQFDPGDLAELRSALDPQLPPEAVYEAIVATKHKEVLSPNLPLAWGISSVDGFDGGVLPLRHYAEFTQLFTGAPSADGRLRENVADAPPAHLLGLVNARYLITDKVNDRWLDGVYYDTQFTLTLSAGETFDLAHVPLFEATALGLLTDAASGIIRITDTSGQTIELPLSNPQSPVISLQSSIINLLHPLTPTRLSLVGPLTVRGLSLIDTRTGAFQSLTLGRYRLVHSGDVKVYENLDVLPRAFVVSEVVTVADDAEARALLAASTFDPKSKVILSTDGGAQRTVGGRFATATIHEYTPERIQLSATGPGYLLLTDAFYPGWTATVNGAPATILRANILFRSVWLPEGEHRIEFRYEPLTAMWGLWISGVSWPAVVALGLWAAKTNPRSHTKGHEGA
ncbi:MAG: YfhO family protein [Anaerolineales bacterium]|nr:YfhO family protein [Anaerolineales bacterium]